MLKSARIRACVIDIMKRTCVRGRACRPCRRACMPCGYRARPCAPSVRTCGRAGVACVQSVRTSAQTVQARTMDGPQHPMLPMRPMRPMRLQAGLSGGVFSRGPWVNAEVRQRDKSRLMMRQVNDVGGFPSPSRSPHDAAGHCTDGRSIRQKVKAAASSLDFTSRAPIQIQT